MSWSDFEYSTASGQPVRLYEFTRAGVAVCRVTNADRDVGFYGETWTAEPVSDSGTGTGEDESLELTVPVSNPVVQMFRGMPPSETVRVRVLQFHHSDDDQNFRVFWVGAVTECKRQAIDRATLVSISLSAAFSRSGLRLTYSRSCPYCLYDINCRVNPADYARPAIITALDGASITVDMTGVDEGYFAAGYVEWVADGFTERRGLRNQTGNEIGVYGGTDGLTLGQHIILYPGCSRTIDICASKFRNQLNYGGIPGMPGISPYEIIKLF